MKLIWYIITIVFSTVLLFLGNLYSVSVRESFQENQVQQELFDSDIVINMRARVTEIISINVYNTAPIILPNNTLSSYTIKDIFFLAELENGEVVSAIQSITDQIPVPDRQVQVNDRIILQHNQFYNIYGELIDIYQIFGFIRINQMIIFGVIVFFAIILFGKFQGLNSLVALGFTISSIFFVFVPVILYGANIYLWSIIISLYSTMTTVLIVIGATKKAVSTIIGTLFSIAVTAFLTVIMSNILGMTGVLDQEIVGILMYNDSLDLNAIVFAGIVIGSIGAIMDVCMSISSSLWEFSQTNKNSFIEIYKTGITVGKDILGTMANTLVLAYIGSYLSIILIISITFSDNIFDVFHMESIITELLRALVGISGIFLAIPITTFTCSWLYQTKDKNLNTLQ